MRNKGKMGRVYRFRDLFDAQPMFTVEKPGFRKLLGDFDPRYKLPSRKYFSETAIPRLYSSLRDKVKD